MQFSSVPAYSFGKSKSHKVIHKIPGPSDYYVNWHKLSNKKESSKAVIPQAGLYNRRRVIRETRNAKGREILENSYKGRYSSTGPSRYKRRGQNRGAPFSSRDRFSNGKEINERVGPGSYNIYNSSLSRKNGAIFSTAPKNLEALRKSKESAPGPGQYLGQISSLKRKGYARSSTGRKMTYEQSERSHNPGPSDYYYDYSSFKGRGVAKMRELTPEKSNFSTPGPGDYNAYNTNNFKRGVFIPKVGRSSSIENTPGPGYYVINQKMRDKKRSGAAIIPTARKRGNGDPTPGPSDYQGLYSSFQGKGVARISSEPRWKKGMEPTPGPSDYKYKYSYLKKGHKFKRQRRWNRGEDVHPGPGYYNIKRSVPDVASYLLKYD